MTKLTTKITAAIAAAAASGGITLATAGVASANTITPVVSVTDNNNVLTTASAVYVGEVLTEFGYGTGQFVITSVTADGPGLSRVTLNAPPVNDTVPHQNSLVVDFYA